MWDYLILWYLALGFSWASIRTAISLKCVKTGKAPESMKPVAKAITQKTIDDVLEMKRKHPNIVAAAFAYSFLLTIFKWPISVCYFIRNRL